jgi:hypothetical protein
MSSKISWHVRAGVFAVAIATSAWAHYVILARVALIIT